jgi:hypothetical protein
MKTDKEKLELVSNLLKIMKKFEVDENDSDIEMLKKYSQQSEYVKMIKQVLELT